MSQYKYVGTKVDRPDIIGKVTGETKFAADLNQTNQLYGAILRSPHAYADIISYDLSEAEVMEGVVTVITGEEEHTGIGAYSAEMPTLAYKVVRYHGEPVVAIAAETLEIAKAACEKVKVEYKLRKPIMTLDESYNTDVAIHDWSQYKCASSMYYEQGTNIAQHTRVRHGDIEKGFAESDYVIEGVYETSPIQHVCIEGHVAIAQFNREGLTVWTCAQSPFFMRGQLAKAFHLPQNKVRMIITPIGGGFGNKWELRAEPLAAALAKRTNGRPVKLVFDRQDEFLGAYIRGGQKIRIKSGVMKDGTLVAREVFGLQDSGAYVNGAPRLCYLSTYAAAGPYIIPNVKIDSHAMITNKVPTSAYRGFGIPEVSFAQECHMDDIAKEIGMDRIEFRLKNIVHDGDTYHTGEKLFSVGAKDCLVEVAEDLKLDEDFERVTKDGRLRGRGLGVTGKITGTPSGSSCVIKMAEDGTVTLLKSGTEMGQGNDSVAQILGAEALQLDISKVRVPGVDTTYSPYEKSATGTRLTFHMGNVILKCAKKIHDQLKTRMADEWGCPVEDIVIEGGIIKGHDPYWQEKELAMNDIGKSGILHEQNPIIATASYNTVHIWDKPDKETGKSSRISSLWFYVCQGAQVLVDPKTGKIEVEKVSSGHDVGQAINADAIMGQIEGGVNQGLGHALLEELVWDDEGHLMNGNMADFHVPTAKDAGYDVTGIITGPKHPEGPYGAKGIGELTVAAIAAAVGNAVYDATGVRPYKIPIKADEFYLQLKEAGLTEGGTKKC